MKKKNNIKNLLRNVLFIFLIYFTIKHIYLLYLKNTENFMDQAEIYKTCKSSCKPKTTTTKGLNGEIITTTTKKKKNDYRKCFNKCRTPLVDANNLEIKQMKPIFKRIMGDFMTHVFSFGE